MGALIQDLRYGLRTLAGSPGFTAVAVLTLALGIGACTAIFSVVNVLLLRPLPYVEPDRLVVICEQGPDLPEMSVAYPNFLDWQAESRSFERLAAFRFVNLNVTGGDADPERVDGRSVTFAFLATLGAPPVLGRDFIREDDRPGAEPVAILGNAFWKRRFAADPGVVGRNILLDGRSYTVIGVAPARLRFLGEPDVWAPLGLDADRFMERGEHPGIYVVGRLGPGVTLAAARAELDGIAKRLEAQYPDSNAAHRIGVTAAPDYFVRDIRPILLVLLGAVGFVLLIACVNVANLMLARGIARDREIAVRVALGAGRRRLVRMLLTESLLLSSLGAALGILLAFWGVDLLAAAVPPDFPLPERIGIDGPVLAFTLVVAVLTGILSGLAPALRTSRVELSRTLKEGGRGSTAGHTRLRQALVVSETALALVLLIGAGLAMKSFLHLARVDPGLNPENVLTLRISLPESRYPDGPGQARFFKRALERIETLPGVVAAGMITPLPFTGEGWQSNYLVEGRPRPPAAEQPSLDKHFVSPGYFRAMQIPLVEGRLFAETDDANAMKVAVINRTMAGRFWPGEDAVGKRIQQGDSDDPAKA
ncbi:MAG TPA: ABC transporter permease, partial [Candidatus Polarisedimenticolia bacterium]|nr:ABC transporter permease [Candidatus Polarisedimenticolia bacterium]